ISASVIEVGGTKAVVAEVVGTLQQLPMTFDILAMKLLAFSSGGTSQDLASLTSASLPALRSYLDARASYRDGHFNRARDLFRKAVEIDSTFALAAMGHILSNSWEDTPDDFEETSRRVLVGNMNRLGPVD